MTSHLYRHLYALVEQVPAGAVTTYGQLSRLAGCTPRTVGFAMAALPHGTGIPWQRVINSQGKISPRAEGDRERLQRDLLLAEGVEFDRTGRIDLAKHGWQFTTPD